MLDLRIEEQRGRTNSGSKKIKIEGGIGSKGKTTTRGKQSIAAVPSAIAEGHAGWAVKLHQKEIRRNGALEED